jgi:hypothetical protein
MKNLFIPRKKRHQFNLSCGDKFGKLTYTGLTYTKSLHGTWRRIIEARCECGNVREYLFDLVARGDTQSCGCFRKEVVKKRMVTHGLSNHKLYDVWQHMIMRCYDEKDKAYHNYGGRGIEVWKEWKDDFLEFYEWCMVNGYNEGLSLDRTDNDGNYAPYNCKFATRPEQNRNQRGNRYFTAFGETKCLWDWGKDERCKVTVWGLRSRIDNGWEGSFEEALITPLKDRLKVARNKKGNVNITAFGETKCMSAWLEDERCLVKLDSLRDRFKKGWDGERILTTPPHSSGKKGILNSK